MTPVEFKRSWMVRALNEWLEFDFTEIEKAPINNTTKDFLKVGFPRDAAPFLDFEWTSYANKFLNIFECYSKINLSIATKNYWILGSDNSGNPICIDVSNNDRIVLLDHEQKFELLDIVNNNIAEFAECLLLYKNFVSQIQAENGEDAYLDQNISDNQISDLKTRFKQVNANIFKESGFWCNEIRVLGK
jgi:hypothetical protein